LEELTTEPERYLSFGSNQWAVSRAKWAHSARGERPYAVGRPFSAL
jgi:hypothetical protein